MHETAEYTYLGIAWLIPLFPLVGVIINGLLGKKLPKLMVGYLACATVFASFVLSVLCVRELAGLDPSARRVVIDVFPWIEAGNLKIMFGVMVDQLSSVMILVVTGVGFLIHVYSLGYMANDEGFKRFFVYLNLFTASMLILVLGNSLALLFVGWELVGLCSYLLIGFWFQKDSAASAGKKAFIVNRVGDFGFILGLLAIFWVFGTVNFQEIFEIIESNAPVQAWFLGGNLKPVAEVLRVGTPFLGLSLATVITLALFLGATGKSAQIPLYVWLPDAMEGPTPVSALIHAATMVTAGVYMVCRMSMLYAFSTTTLMVIACIGATTAIFAASIGLVQNDIKRVLAYSTVSQLGYMFLACGVGAYAVGVFHLMTHAFFKALMFLGSGSVIHSCEHSFHKAGSHADPQDMRNMGGLMKYMKITGITFWVGALAIAGFPGLSGFFSKDEILWKAFSTNIFPDGVGHKLWILGAAAAIMTAFYMFRLIFMTFHGKERMPEGAHPHESPASMTNVLIVLAVLAIIGGYVGVPHIIKGVGTDTFYTWLSPVFIPAETIVAQGDSYAGMATKKKTILTMTQAERDALYQQLLVKYNGDEEEALNEEYYLAEAARKEAIEEITTAEEKSGHKEAADAFDSDTSHASLYRETKPIVGLHEEEHGEEHGNTKMEWTLMIVSIISALIGICIAFVMYNRKPELHHSARKGLGPIHTVLLNKYFVDEIYYYTIVYPGRMISEFFLWKLVDKYIIDGLVNGVAILVRAIGSLTSKFQTGVVLNYALIITLGVAALLYFLI